MVEERAVFKGTEMALLGSIQRSKYLSIQQNTVTAGTSVHLRIQESQIQRYFGIALVRQISIGIEFGSKGDITWSEKHWNQLTLASTENTNYRTL